MTQRLVDQVDDHFGRKHGVYGSALSDMALMMKSTGKHQEATEINLKALEVCCTSAVCCPPGCVLCSVCFLPCNTNDFQSVLSPLLRRQSATAAGEKKGILFKGGDIVCACCFR